MKQSDNIANLAKSLIVAHKAIDSAVATNSINETFSSNYADLGAVLKAIKPALNAAGIVVVQSPTTSERNGCVSLTTRLLHETGEWMEDTCTTPMTHMDPQAFGTGISYMRRYALAAMMGLYQADDDGGAASGNGFRVTAKTDAGNDPQSPSGPSTPPAATESDIAPEDRKRVAQWLNTIQNASMDRLGTARETAKESFKGPSLAVIQKAIADREIALQ